MGARGVALVTGSSTGIGKVVCEHLLPMLQRAPDMAIGGAERVSRMLVDRIVALRHANIYAKHYYRHVLSNVNVKGLDGDELVVQSNYVVLQTLVEGDTHVFNAGKYLDRMVATPDGLRFKRKVVVFDTYRIPNLLVTPL